MKKSGNTEAQLKKKLCLYKKACIFALTLVNYPQKATRTK